MLAIESMHERPIRLLALLISKMATSGELSSTAIEKGFDRLYVALPDLSIDLPPAFSLAEWWTKAALDAGFIGKAIADRLPRKYVILNNHHHIHVYLQRTQTHRVGRS